VRLRQRLVLLLPVIALPRGGLQAGAQLVDAPLQAGHRVVAPLLHLLQPRGRGAVRVFGRRQGGRRLRVGVGQRRVRGFQLREFVARVRQGRLAAPTHEGA
jgi:hypothetical protein